MSEIPDKLFYKVAEVCKYTDTQPYVLRFWESEFPQLARGKSRGGQRVYSREDLDLVIKIKTLLYEQEYTIAGVRDYLDRDESTGPSRADRPVGAELEPEWEQLAGPAPAIVGSTRAQDPPDSYKASYEAARTEIEALRRKLSDTEERWREAEQARERAQEKAGKVVRRLEEVLTGLGAAEASEPAP